MRYLLVVLAVVIAGCKPTPAPKPAPAPATTTPEPTVVAAEPTPVEPKVEQSTWSERPPVGQGLPYRMTRDANGIEVFRGDVRFRLDELRFGDCGENIPDPTAPEEMPLGDADDEPVWLQLRSDSEAASLRLSTRGAWLIVDDGCQRTAHLTAALLGTANDADDPVFAPDAVAPENSVEAPGFELRPSESDAEVWRDERLLLTLHGLAPEATLTARKLDAMTWVRVASGVERASKDGESVAGREITHVFGLAGESPELLMKNDFRYGAEGADREESRATATRALGPWTASGTRTSVVDAMNIGAGRCPEMEGVLAFRFENEEVVWTVASNGESHRLGTAKRRAMFASGCLDEARSEVRRRKTLLADKIPPTPLSWTAAP